MHGMKKNKRRQQYYWNFVRGCQYELRLSITLFSCLELQYVSYTEGISARLYDQSDDDVWKSLPDTALLNIFCKSELKDRLQSFPLVCKSWKTVTDDPRCWSSMIPDSVSPEDAFIKKSSYCTSGYKFESYEPKSCIRKKDNDFLFKEEGYDYHDPLEVEEEEEHALIKKTCRHPFKFKSYRLNHRLIPNKYYIIRDYYNYLDGVSRLFKEEGDHEEVVPVGVLRLRTLIEKSKGGAAITTLYLSPFFPYDHLIRHVRQGRGQILGGHTDEDYNEILHIISSCCPNLKHISFDVRGHISEETLRLLFNSCEKLELIDFSFRGFHARNPLFVEVLGSCCLPNLQGICIFEDSPNIIQASIAKYLPQLKLLSFQSVALTSKNLSIILVSCLKLQYLHVHEYMYPRLHYYGDILRQAYSQIPEFHYDYYCRSLRSPESYDDEYHSAGGSELAGVDELNCFEDYDYYYCTDYDDNILQQRQVKKEYMSICFDFYKKKARVKEYHILDCGHDSVLF